MPGIHKSNNQRIKWLMNFSSSYKGGGLKRLEESAKWFDNHAGAIFIINIRAVESVSRYSTKNRYIIIEQSKIGRFFSDGKYLPSIINEIGVPDIYFSYGIPVFYQVGRINWLHLSNALTLTDRGYNMPFSRRIEHAILGRRIGRSMKYVNIATAESEFSLDLLKNAKSNNNTSCKYVILENGYDDLLFNRKTNTSDLDTGNYAITIGTAPYKNLNVALSIFEVLQKAHPEMVKFKIIGDKNGIPINLRIDKRVEPLGSGFSNEMLYDLLVGAKFYISASQIENSSIAALEGLVLSQNVALSDIPPHREICRNLAFEEIKINGNENFIIVNNNGNGGFNGSMSWNDVLIKMNNIAKDFIISP